MSSVTVKKCKYTFIIISAFMNIISDHFYTCKKLCTAKNVEKIRDKLGTLIVKF